VNTLSPIILNLCCNHISRFVGFPDPRPFSHLSMPLHRPHFTSPQIPHLAPSRLPAPTAPKHTTPDSPPPALPPPKDALRTNAASYVHPAHADVRLAPTPTAPQPPPFSPLDVHPHTSHLASPQPPHLAPPPSPAPPAQNCTRPDSPPPVSPPPKDALRTDAASYVHSAHADVRLALTPTAPQPPPFSPLDVHTHHPPHLASPQTPHLAPSPLSAPAAPKRTGPDSPPTASPPPQDALRTEAVSADSLKAHDATERETKKPRHQVAHGEHALTHHNLATQEHPARPTNWDSMSRKARKNWMAKQAKHLLYLNK